MSMKPASHRMLEGTKSAKPLATWTIVGLVAVAVAVICAAVYVFSPYLHHEAIDADVLPGIGEPS